MIWHLKARTGIWTGDAERKGDRLIPTGLLGSIRWWFEVVVRGLGSSACDPTEHQCPDHEKKPHEAGHHCVVCELFGCTGWARKFRFDVLDGNDQIKTIQIKKGDTFRLRFTPLRPIRPEEWALLDFTLRLIAGYGAIGGKTVYKPSDEQSRHNAQHHWDYGLVKLVEPRPQLQPINGKRLKEYVKRWRQAEQGDYAWASIANFWCVPDRYLARQNNNSSTFNRVLGRKEPKNQGQQLRDKAECVDKWLAGKQQESKKVFSFKNPPRTFGFVKPGVIDFAAMRQRLKEGAWSDLRDDEFIEGPKLLDRLLGDGGGAIK